MYYYYNKSVISRMTQRPLTRNQLASSFFYLIITTGKRYQASYQRYIGNRSSFVEDEEISFLRKPETRLRKLELAIVLRCQWLCIFDYSVRDTFVINPFQLSYHCVSAWKNGNILLPREFRCIDYYRGQDDPRVGPTTTRQTRLES